MMVPASPGLEGADRGALLTEVAGGLVAEDGVLGSQAGDFCACGVQAGAERFSGGALGWGRGCWLGWGGAQSADQVADVWVVVEPGPGYSG